MVTSLITELDTYSAGHYDFSDRLTFGVPLIQLLSSYRMNSMSELKNSDRRRSNNIRILLYYGFAVIILTVYGGQV